MAAPPISRHPPPPFCLSPPFLAKIFRPPAPPPIFINFEKVNPPSPYHVTQGLEIKNLKSKASQEIRAHAFDQRIRQYFKPKSKEKIG